MTNWFDTARFGMFVHWGHSSQQGIELSWPLVGGVAALPQCTAVPVDQYHASAATFDPKSYDPAAWARQAKRAGMQYAVFTTKHHDGYAMFDTADLGLLRDALAVRPRHLPRIRRRHARGGHPRRRLLLADRLAPSRLPAVHAGRRAVRLGQVAAARSRALAALHRRHVRAGARAPHQLRPHRRDLVRWRLGAQHRAVALERARRHDPRAAAGHPHQRPPAGCRRLHDAGAVRARAGRPPARGRPA